VHCLHILLHTENESGILPLTLLDDDDVYLDKIDKNTTQTTPIQTSQKIQVQ
jgi:hypothetical protein